MSGPVFSATVCQKDKTAASCDFFKEEKIRDNKSSESRQRVERTKIVLWNISRVRICHSEISQMGSGHYIYLFDFTWHVLQCYDYFLIRYLMGLVSMYFSSLTDL